MGYLIAVSAGCPFAVTTVFVPAELGFYKRESAQSAVDRINAAISRAEAAEAALAPGQTVTTQRPPRQYSRIADMPVSLLARAIKERRSYDHYD